MATTHVLRPRPPIRAFALAAALCVVGAVLTVVLAANDAGVGWIVFAVVVLVLGLALLAAAGYSLVRLRTYVDLTDEGWTVRGPGDRRSGSWDDVTKVTISYNGAHITMHHGQVARTHIIAPGNIASEEMKALAADIAKYLDASRGYHNPEA